MSELSSEVCSPYLCFVKQKTAYEKRISDWISDVCSSDLPGAQRQHIALELVAHHAGDHLGHALDGFKHYIPDEPIANHHIDRALADIVALDVAVEIQAAGTQQLGRLLDYLVALGDLFADVEQTHRRMIPAVDGGHRTD